MDERSLIKSLEGIGLSQKEAGVYYATLKLGGSSVSAIARAAGVKRTTAYSIIEKLKEREFIHNELRGLKEVFVAANPERLEELLEERRGNFLQALPHLSALQQLDGSESVIRYHTGLDSMKRIYNELMQSVKIGDYYLVLSDIESWRSLDKEFMDDFVQRRAKLDIQVRMILTDTPLAHARKTKLREANERTRILPRTTTLQTNLVITPQKAFVHQLAHDAIGMVIENEQMIQMHREMYELIWEGLKD